MDNYDRLIEELAKLLDCHEDEKTIKYAIRILKEDAEGFDKLAKELEAWRLKK